MVELTAPQKQALPVLAKAIQDNGGSYPAGSDSYRSIKVRCNVVYALYNKGLIEGDGQEGIRLTRAGQVALAAI